MTKPLLPPPNRDTTPNPADLIAQRLCSLLLAVSAIGAVAMTVAALAGRNDGKFGFAISFAIAFVLLLLSRPWWQKSSPQPTLPTKTGLSAPRTTAPAPATAASTRRPRILLINASLNGKTGNSAVLLAEAQSLLAPHADVQLATLTTHPDLAQLQPAFEAADGFVLATGTHWDSWSSVLQKFLEDATPVEGTALLLGKPAAVLVTEHSTGGKGILSRLQGVLVTLGCSIPPMSGLVLSRAAVIAAQHDPEASADFWCRDDLAVVCHNLLAAATGTRTWRAWSVDRTDAKARWLN
jgi:NAD(P)H-dependent FMN reductase